MNIVQRDNKQKKMSINSPHSLAALMTQLSQKYSICTLDTQQHLAEEENLLRQGSKQWKMWDVSSQFQGPCQHKTKKIQIMQPKQKKPTKNPLMLSQPCQTGEPSPKLGKNLYRDLKQPRVTNSNPNSNSNPNTSPFTNPRDDQYLREMHIRNQRLKDELIQVRQLMREQGQLIQYLAKAKMI